jgi:hypothetical protein
MTFTQVFVTNDIDKIHTITNETALHPNPVLQAGREPDFPLARLYPFFGNANPDAETFVGQ